MLRRPIILASVTVLSLALAETAHSSTTETRSGANDRSFEFQVRAPFFRGIEGDAEQFALAMRICEEKLAEDPDHAEALVWHGAGLFFEAGTAFQQGDFPNGSKKWTDGLAKMQRAVDLSPRDVAVRIPRGATLLQASRNTPIPSQATQLLELAVTDYEVTYDLQRSYFDKLSEHARGELLLGLLDGYQRLDRPDQVEETLDRIRTSLAGSDYLTQVETALATDNGLQGLGERTCSGCHN